MTNVILTDDKWHLSGLKIKAIITLHFKRRANMNTPAFFDNLKRYFVALVFLTAINLITSPNNLWVVWPALGMGIALLNELLNSNNSKRVRDEC